eukprot:43544-Prorocentrum_lima.AAC.1
MADQVQTMGITVHSARTRALENEVSNEAAAAVMWGDDTLFLSSGWGPSSATPWAWFAIARA